MSLRAAHSDATLVPWSWGQQGTLSCKADPSRTLLASSGPSSRVRTSHVYPRMHPGLPRDLLRDPSALNDSCSFSHWYKRL